MVACEAHSCSFFCRETISASRTQYENEEKQTKKRAPMQPGGVVQRGRQAENREGGGRRESVSCDSAYRIVLHTSNPCGAGAQ